jgi:hypothetical protein
MAEEHGSKGHDVAKFMYVPVAKDKTDGFTGNPKKSWKDYKPRYFTEGLQDVADDDKLYIVGHGSLSGTSLQTLTASKLLDVLKVEKLAATHKKFYLFSCYSGVKMPGAGRSFAEEFAYAIRDYYKSATVVGYIGAVQFNRDGWKKTVSTVSQFGVKFSPDNMVESMQTTNGKVSFSINRKFIGTNSVVANQTESYEAAVTNEEETLSFMGESMQGQYQRVVVVGSDAIAGRARR